MSTLPRCVTGSNRLFYSVSTKSRHQVHTSTPSCKNSIRRDSLSVQHRWAHAVRDVRKHETNRVVSYTTHNRSLALRSGGIRTVAEENTSQWPEGPQLYMDFATALSPITDTPSRLHGGLYYTSRQTRWLERIVPLIKVTLQAEVEPLNVSNSR